MTVSTQVSRTNRSTLVCRGRKAQTKREIFLNVSKLLLQIRLEYEKVFQHRTSPLNINKSTSNSLTGAEISLATTSGNDSQCHSRNQLVFVQRCQIRASAINHPDVKFMIQNYSSAVISSEHRCANITSNACENEEVRTSEECGVNNYHDCFVRVYFHVWRSWDGVSVWVAVLGSLPSVTAVQLPIRRQCVCVCVCVCQCCVTV